MTGPVTARRLGGALVLSLLVLLGCGAPDAGTGPAPTVDPTEQRTSGNGTSNGEDDPDNGGHQHENPNPPPGVRHDIPARDDDYSKQSTWEIDVADNCVDAQQSPDCLSLTYAFENTDGETVLDPGTDYHNHDVYSDCRVDRVDPPNGDSESIPSGSSILVTVRCVPVAPADAGENGDAEDGTTSSSATDGNG